jgi:hypothetical protein
MVQEIESFKDEVKILDIFEHDFYFLYKVELLLTNKEFKGGCQ